MRALILVLILLLASGCIIGGSKSSIKLESDIVPSKVGLDEPQNLTLEVQVINIGNAKETVSADAISTEGLNVYKPERTEFALKPGESRTIIFNAALTEDAVPGNYIIDVQVKTGTGEIVTGVARLRVVQKKGII